MRATLCDNPNNIRVSIILSLVFRPGGDKGKIAGRELMASKYTIESLLDKENAGTGGGVDDGILTCSIRGGHAKKTGGER